MKPVFQTQCDLFIQRCQDAIDKNDADEARNILVEATSIFGEVIPNWNGGLMSKFTEFYLDDARMILGKLSTFKASGYKASPRDFMRSRHEKMLIETDELFEAAIVEVQKSAAESGKDSKPIISKFREMQMICTNQLKFSERWELLRPFMKWVSTLDIDFAQHVLPLFVRSITP